MLDIQVAIRLEDQMLTLLNMTTEGLLNISLIEL
jgi:hypothetical protein